MESAHTIDPASNLIGLSNIPSGSGDSGKPGVLLINAGFLHRVGPNRMNTTLARTLAEQGFASLRLDLSGLGDSMHHSNSGQDYQVVSEDLHKAMDFMASRFNIEEFVLIGLCSGAYDTARKAMEDERVVGLVNIDGTGYRTQRFYVNHFFLHLLRRVGQPHRWRRLLRRLGERSLKDAMTGSGHLSILNTTAAYTDWTLEQSGRNFESLANRGVRMNFIYTGGVSGFYNYRSQFWDIFKDFDFKGMASTSYFPSTDHLNMLQHHREEVHQSILAWFNRSFP